MDKKELYTEATMNVIQFEAEDIIATSNTGSNSGGGIVLPDDNW